jgi:hypothetical protein
MTGRWFSPGTLVSSTNKTDHYDITEILLKVAINTITHHHPKKGIGSIRPGFVRSKSGSVRPDN